VSKDAECKRLLGLLLSEDQLGEEERHLMRLSSLNKSEVCTVEELDDEATLVGSLGLLCAHQVELKANHISSIHIRVSQPGRKCFLAVLIRDSILT
jgi:hypothetical protein